MPLFCHIYIVVSTFDFQVIGLLLLFAFIVYASGLHIIIRHTFTLTLKNPSCHRFWLPQDGMYRLWHFTPSSALLFKRLALL